MGHGLRRGFPKTEPAQTGNSLRVHAFASDQHLKRFSHTGGRDQMFELQRNFRPLLGLAAFFERVGKLIALADP